MFEMIWIMGFSGNNLGMPLTNLGDFAKHYTTPAGDVSRFTAGWKLCTNLNPSSIILHRPIFQKRWILVLFGSLLLFPKQRSHERLRQPDGEHLGSWSPSAQISQGFYPMDFLVKDMEATSSLVSSPRILLGIPMDSIWFHLPAVNAVNAAGPASDSGEPSAALGSLVQCSKPLVDYARSDGEIGHGTSLRNMMFSTKKIITVKPLKIYISYYTVSWLPQKKDFWAGCCLVGRSHMFINREGPTQSSIAKHVFGSGCWLIRAAY